MIYFFASDIIISPTIQSHIRTSLIKSETFVTVVEYLTSFDIDRRRERARKKKYECSKCMYELPPFEPCFDPIENNKYVKR